METKISIYKLEDYPTNFLEILNDLYLPIIGRDALNLYLCYSSNDDKKYSFDEFVSLGELNHDAFYLANKKLIALRLISKYVKDEETIILVKSPISPYKFLSSVSLKTLFESTTTKKVQNAVFKKYIKDLNLDGFTKIDVCLSEIFTFSIDNCGDKNELKVQDTIKNKSGFSTSKCYSYLKKKIKLSIEDFSNEEVEKIADLANLFAIKEQKMSDLLIKCINIDEEVGKRIDFERLQKNINFYLKYDSNLPKEIKKDVKLTFKSNSDNSKLVEYYLSISPVELLEKSLGGIKPGKSEIDIVKLLQDKYNFSNGIINVLLDFQLNKYGFLNTNYIESYASFFKRKNVEDVFKALDVLYTNNKEVKKDNENKHKDIYETKKDDKVMSGSDLINKDVDIDTITDFDF